jgi:hypothetical protein
MDYASFVYETCAGDHNIYAPICNNGVIEHILKTTKPSSEQLTEEHTTKQEFLYHQNIVIDR